MVLLDNVFMMAMFVVGLLLFIASIMMGNEIDSNECGNQSVRRLNTGISTIGVILTTSSISFLVCKNTCACSDEEKSANMFLGLSAMLSITVLVMAVMINNQLSGPCDEAKKWATILTAISGTTAAFSIGLLIYRFYLDKKGLLTGGPKKEVQILKPNMNDEAMRKHEELNAREAAAQEKSAKISAAARVAAQQEAIARQEERLIDLQRQEHTEVSGVSPVTRGRNRSSTTQSAGSMGSIPSVNSTGSTGGLFGLNRQFSSDTLSDSSMFTGLKGGYGTCASGGESMFTGLKGG